MTTPFSQWLSEINKTIHSYDFDQFKSSAANFKTESEEYILSRWREMATIIGVYLAISFGLWIWKSHRLSRNLPQVKKVLLVTAHPDDEAMFFGPTLLGLAKDGAVIYLMCLSQGDYEGEGKRRKLELYKSCSVLGIPESNVVILKYDDLPDDPEVTWSSSIVANLVLRQVEIYGIDTLVTFDCHGVSYHENHISTWNGVSDLITEGRLPTYCTAYELCTVNILRKYSFCLDSLLTFMTAKFTYFLSWSDHTRVTRAMAAHSSQYVWFRRLFIVFSRYAYMNHLKPIGS